LTQDDVKHTPGPWVLDRNADIRTHEDHWAGSVEGNLIAYVAHTEDVMGEANAHLIAAAPDLLKVVRLLRGSVEVFARDLAARGHNGSAAILDSDLRCARAVIAKAEGTE